MKLTVNLAKMETTISFLGQARKAIPLCNSYFRGFLSEEQRADTEVVVSVLEKPIGGFPFQEKAANPVFEQLLPTEDVAGWLRGSPEHRDDFPISEKTISSLCLGGLLLFNPDTAAGRIYLLEAGSRRFRPLYRLLWMYFAQTLGERRECFVHAAALVRNGEGHLFMGDSGSGKSTLAKHCSGCHVLSDDGPIITRQNGECLIYPSPYHQMDPVDGLEKDVTEMIARVKGIYFLIKDTQFFLEDVSRGEALLMILKRYIHFFPYLSTQAKKALFDLFSEACYKIPIYNLRFRRDQDVGSVINNK